MGSEWGYRSRVVSPLIRQGASGSVLNNPPRDAHLGIVVYVLLSDFYSLAEGAPLRLIFDPVVKRHDASTTASENVGGTAACFLDTHQWPTSERHANLLPVATRGDDKRPVP